MLLTDAPPAHPRLAYISFDIVPAPKGASTHIAAFTRELARAFGAVDLVTVSAAGAFESRTERWPGVFHTALPALGMSLIDRVLCFRRCLDRWLAARQFDLIQFRSIFEGLPLLRLQPAPQLIFEVNGLPSIELKYRYPRAADDRELMHKVAAQEQACLQAAGRIVTPSAVTARYLTARRAVAASKIRVIPNGVDTNLFRPRDSQAFVGQTSVCAGLQSRSSPPRSSTQTGEVPLLYFGTLTQWQGVDLAVRAVAQICAHTPVRLTILGAGSSRQREPISALAAKLGIASQIEIAPPVEQPELVRALHRTFAVLAPLALNDRNTLQGCCPLKILETMAAGIPVIASDLPVVRELAEHGRNCLLVKPGSVDQVVQAVLQLRADPDLWQRLSVEGHRHVLDRYTWERSGASLIDVCAELGISPASNS